MNKRGDLKCSGCSAARLAHHVRDVGVGSSNLLTPTTEESLSGGSRTGFFVFYEAKRLA